jgi:hypothetical protein
MPLIASLDDNQMRDGAGCNPVWRLKLDCFAPFLGFFSHKFAEVGWRDIG